MRGTQITKFTGVLYLPVSSWGISEVLAMDIAGSTRSSGLDVLLLAVERVERDLLQLDSEDVLREVFEAGDLQQESGLEEDPEMESGLEEDSANIGLEYGLLDTGLEGETTAMDLVLELLLLLSSVCVNLSEINILKYSNS